MFSFFIKNVSGRVCRFRIRFLFYALPLLSTATCLQADVERTIDFQYDAAGNTIQKLTQEQDSAPTFSTFSPNFINKGQSVVITATGSNFLNATVATATLGLSISETTPTVNQISFRLSALSFAPIGNASIDINTSLGTVTGIIAVAEEAPAITTTPKLVAISKNTTTDITVNFSLPRTENESYTINVGDGSILTTAGSFTVLAGQSQAVISLTGVVDGVTNLDIILSNKFYFYSFPVFVGKSFAEMLIEFPDMKQQTIFTDVVGVYVEPANQFPVNAVFSEPVGVLVDSTPNIISEAIGVQIGLPKNYSEAIEVIVGPILDTVQPTIALRGSVTALQISGFNLNEVQSITTTPGTNVAVGTYSVNAQNTLLTVPLTINAAATVGQYTLTLTGASGVIRTHTGAQLVFNIQ